MVPAVGFSPHATTPGPRLREGRVGQNTLSHHHPTPVPSPRPVVRGVSVHMLPLAWLAPPQKSIPILRPSEIPVDK